MGDLIELREKIYDCASRIEDLGMQGKTHVRVDDVTYLLMRMIRYIDRRIDDWRVDRTAEDW